jgi:plasmid stabilization system protein ParE
MTSWRISFHPAALAEAEAARDWYADRNPTVARAFVAELQGAVRSIVNSPKRWPFYTENTRRDVFPRFPFNLIYRLSERNLQIVAVAHTSRKPGYWKER